MALRKPAVGLRRIHHNANSPKRVEVIVPAGAEMEVPAEVAEQLTAADSHFQPVTEPTEGKPRTAAKKTTSRGS